MPKKHRQTYLSSKPNYVHPTLGGGKRGAAAEQAAPSPITVNERLSQLRLTQSSPAAAYAQQEIAELSSQRSLPPNVGQGILGLAPTAAPRARLGLRSRIRVRTPGPAPPPSWQNTTTSLRQIDESRFRPAGPKSRTFGKKVTILRTRPERLARFLDLIGDSPVNRRSLLGTALKSAAENWDAITEDCLEDLEYLPAHVRVVLLCYVAEYGPPEGIDAKTLQALFPNGTDVKCLDLSGLAGWGLSLKELRRFLTAPIQRPAASEEAESQGLIDSWEEEIGDGMYAPLAPALTRRAPYLTKLSLSHPPSSISWKDLLSLSKDLGTLTHLSLADWPVPTRTPNMKTASYTSNAGLEQAAGGTSLYSAHDNDYQEATVILRQLSENTYCLRWLDLERCSSWIQALVWQGRPVEPNNTASEWESGRGAHGPDWCGPWRNIAYLNLGQEWTPSNRRFLSSAACKGRLEQRYFHLRTTHLQIIQNLVDSAAEQEQDVSRCEVCFALRNSSSSNSGNSGGDFKCGVCTAYHDNEVRKLARWLEKEAEAWTIAQSINNIRAGSGSARCTFDHGWQKRETYSVYTKT